MARSPAFRLPFCGGTLRKFSSRAPSAAPNPTSLGNSSGVVAFLQLALFVASSQYCPLLVSSRVFSLHSPLCDAIVFPRVIFACSCRWRVIGLWPTAMMNLLIAFYQVSTVLSLTMWLYVMSLTSVSACRPCIPLTKKHSLPVCFVVPSTSRCCHLRAYLACACCCSCVIQAQEIIYPGMVVNLTGVALDAVLHLVLLRGVRRWGGLGFAGSPIGACAYVGVCLCVRACACVRAWV